MDVDSLLKEMKERGASDLHLVAGLFPSFQYSYSQLYQAHVQQIPFGLNLILFLVSLFFLLTLSSTSY